MKRTLLVSLMVFLFPVIVHAATESQNPPPQTHTYVDEPIVGWHWYNEPVPEEENEPEPPEQIPLASLSPTLQKKVMQKLTQEALDTAIMQPSPENAAKFMTLQRFWLTKAGQFERSTQKALLQTPSLDYNLEHSYYNSTVPSQLAELRTKEQKAIQELAAEYGLFFFYRGGEAIDNQLASIVSQFAEQYGVALIPISVDGTRSELLPNTRTDSGQIEKMQITHFPALFLVDPKSERYQPLAYGFMTQDALARRFLDIATDFKPNY